MQLLTHKLGGKVVPAGDAGNREYGQSELTLTESSALLPEHQMNRLVLMSHGMLLQKFLLTLFVQVLLPTVHMHPLKTQIRKSTVSNSTQRFVILFTVMISFVTLPLNICGAKGDWTMDNFIEMQIKKSRETVGDKRVLLGLSGGVDSSVVGVLLQKPSAIN